MYLCPHSSFDRLLREQSVVERPDFTRLDLIVAFGSVASGFACVLSAIKSSSKSVAAEWLRNHP
jgi:hypothetical protein